jgi:hypothetical protein
MSWTPSTSCRPPAWHLGAAPFAVLAPFEPVLRGAAVLVVFWAILF